MPRRNQKMGFSRQAGQKVRGDISIRGKALITTAHAAAGVTGITAHSLLAASNSLAMVSTSYNMYRFTKLRFRMRPPTVAPTASGAFLAWALFDETVTTAPTTAVQVANFPVSLVMSLTETVPSTFGAGKSFLLAKNAAKFWKVNALTDAWDNEQFTYYSSLSATQTNTVTTIVEVFYVVEFSDQAGTLSAPTLDRLIAIQYPDVDLSLFHSSQKSLTVTAKMPHVKGCMCDVCARN